MTILIGLLLTTLFWFLSGLHFYWGLGGKWGADATIPTKENLQKVMNPKLIDCFLVAIGLLAFGLLCFIKSSFVAIDLPQWLLHYGIWAISVIFILRAIGEFQYVGFFKKIRSTPFGQLDTKYYSPLCLVIGILAMTLALIT